jgi:hypothetical protein
MSYVPELLGRDMSKRFVVVAMIVGSLVACGQPDAVRTSARSSTSTGTTTTTAAGSKPTTTQTPAPSDLQVLMDCEADGAGGLHVLTVWGTDFSRVWIMEPITCESRRGDEDDPFTPNEQKALKAAGAPEDMYTLDVLYGLCGAVDPADPHADPSFDPTLDQIREINGMLALCPKHPFAGKLRAVVKRGNEHKQEVASGERFYDGTYRVDAEVKPGRYVIEGRIENCYWERTDANGEIVDNNFVLGAARVQVVIAASDYSFTSEGCGEWTELS